MKKIIIISLDDSNKNLLMRKLQTKQTNPSLDTKIMIPDRLNPDQETSIIAIHKHGTLEREYQNADAIILLSKDPEALTESNPDLQKYLVASQHAKIFPILDDTADSISSPTVNHLHTLSSFDPNELLATIKSDLRQIESVTEDKQATNELSPTKRRASSLPPKKSPLTTLFQEVTTKLQRFFRSNSTKPQNPIAYSVAQENHPASTLFSTTKQPATKITILSPDDNNKKLSFMFMLANRTMDSVIATDYIVCTENKQKYIINSGSKANPLYFKNANVIIIIEKPEEAAESKRFSAAETQTIIDTSAIIVRMLDDTDMTDIQLPNDYDYKLSDFNRSQFFKDLQTQLLQETMNTEPPKNNPNFR